MVDVKEWNSLAPGENGATGPIIRQKVRSACKKNSAQDDATYTVS